MAVFPRGGWAGFQYLDHEDPSSMPLHNGGKIFEKVGEAVPPSPLHLICLYPLIKNR